jgi:hypothetical protein
MMQHLQSKHRIVNDEMNAEKAAEVAKQAKND